MPSGLHGLGGLPSSWDMIMASLIDEVENHWLTTAVRRRYLVQEISKCQFSAYVTVLMLLCSDQFNDNVGT